MRIIVIRHEKVDMIWDKKCSSETFDWACEQYDRRPIVFSDKQYDKIAEAKKVYISELSRTYETACRLFEGTVFVKMALSGLVWGLWHTAYYMVFLGDEYFLTSSRLATLMSGCLVTVIGSILFVEIYRMTKSVWSCVILHSVQNAVSAAFMATGISEKYEGRGQMLFDPITGIISLIILAGTGLIIRKARISLDNPPH